MSPLDGHTALKAVLGGLTEPPSARDLRARTSRHDAWAQADTKPRRVSASTQQQHPEATQTSKLHWLPRVHAPLGPIRACEADHKVDRSADSPT